MKRLGAHISLLAVFALTAVVSVQAQRPPADPGAVELQATERVAIESGIASHRVRRDREGNYYVLNQVDRLVRRYNKYLVPAGHIGGKGTGMADLYAPMDLAVMPDGNVAVADGKGRRGWVKIYKPNGVLASSFETKRPWTVGVLSSGEILVSGMDPREHLIYVFSEDGQLLRSFGELVAIDDHPGRNAFLNAGWIEVDANDNIYYTFHFNPNPTIRKYSRNGELLAEFHPEGARLQAASERALRKLEERRAKGILGGSAVIFSLALDGSNGDMWVTCSSMIYRLAADGTRKGVFVFKSPAGRRISATHIVVEENRLIITSGMDGVFSAPKPI